MFKCPYKRKKERKETKNKRENGTKGEIESIHRERDWGSVCMDRRKETTLGSYD